MSGRRLQFGAVIVDKKLIVVGGRDGLKTLNTVECFDFSTLTWSTLPPMNVHRHGLGINTVVENLRGSTSLTLIKNRNDIDPAQIHYNLIVFKSHYNNFSLAK